MTMITVMNSYCHTILDHAFLRIKNADTLVMTHDYFLPVVQAYQNLRVHRGLSQVIFDYALCCVYPSFLDI
jgi:hypothetical protein